MMVQLVLCLVLEALNQAIALSLSYCMQTITNAMTSASHTAFSQVSSKERIYLIYLSTLDFGNENTVIPHIASTGTAGADILKSFLKLFLYTYRSRGS